MSKKYFFKKSLLAFLFSSLLIVAASSVLAEFYDTNSNGNSNANINVSPTITFKRGDANGDQKVNMGDIITIGNAVDRLHPTYKKGDISLIDGCLDAADANNDGTITIADAIFLVNHLFGDGQAIAPPAHKLGCVSYPR